MRLNLQGDPAAFARQMEVEKARIARGFRAGIVTTTDEIKEALRAPIRGCGFRGAEVLAKAWQSAVFPKRNNGTFRPAGLVFSKAPDIHRSMDKGGVIIPRKGRYLAIPSSVNRVTTGGRSATKARVTPEQMAAKGSGAFTRPRKAGAGLLWCLPVIWGKCGALTAGGRKIYTKASGAARAGVAARGFTVMFTLVPGVSSRKILDIAAVRRAVPAMLAKNVSAAVAAEGSNGNP